MSTINTSIVPVSSEEIFTDVECGICEKKIITEDSLKGILKNNKKPKNNRNNKNNKNQETIIKLVIILLVIILVSPFIICDLVFGYTDDTCLDIYPENLELINMKTYLLVSAYYVIGVLIVLLINLNFTIHSDDYKIIIFSFLSIILYISQLFLVIWNIIGGIIFWGTLNNQNLCSKSINTYLFVSLIIKLFVNFSNIMMTKNKKNK